MGFLDAKKFLSLNKAVGKVVAKKVSERARVVVQLNRFNPYLNMYFPETHTIETYDSGDKTIVGDTVLIHKLPKSRRNIETHRIEEIVFHVGHIIDPLTGLRVAQDKFLGEPLKDEDLQQMRKHIQAQETSSEYSFEIDRRKQIFED